MSRTSRASLAIVGTLVACGSASSLDDARSPASPSSSSSTPAPTTTPTSSPTASNGVDASAPADAGDATTTAHGVPDPTFGAQGLVVTPLGLGSGASSRALGLAIRPGLGLVAVGYFYGNGMGTTAVAEYRDDGSLDAAWLPPSGVAILGPAPAVGTSAGFRDKRVYATTSGGKLVRLQIGAGNLDPSFGAAGAFAPPVPPSGLVSLSAHRIEDDGVLVGGTETSATGAGYALWHADATGHLDTAFGSGGKLVLPPPTLTSTAHVTSIARQKSNAIVWGGYAIGPGVSETVVVRATAGGALDPAFGAGGVVHVPSSNGTAGNAILVQDDDSIVVLGSWQSKLVIDRFHADGAPDASFGVGGRTSASLPSPWTTAAPRAAALDGAQRILVTGHALTASGGEQMFVARFSRDGALDASFGTGGAFVANARDSSLGDAIVVAPDGKIAVSGLVAEVYESFAIWRLLP